MSQEEVRESQHHHQVCASASRVVPLQDALDAAIQESAAILQRLREASRTDEDERERNSILAQSLKLSLDGTAAELDESKKREAVAQSQLAVQAQQIESLIEAQRNLLLELEEEQDRSEGLVLDKMALLEWADAAKLMMNEMTESLSMAAMEDEADVPTHVIAERERARADLNRRFERATKSLTLVVKRGVPRFVGNPKEFAERKMKEGGRSGGAGGGGWSAFWNFFGGHSSKEVSNAFVSAGGLGARPSTGATASSSSPSVAGPGATKSSSSRGWDWSGFKSLGNMSLFAGLFSLGKSAKSNKSASAAAAAAAGNKGGEIDGDDSASCVEQRPDMLQSAPAPSQPGGFGGPRSYGDEFWVGEFEEETFEDSDAEESLAEAAVSYSENKRNRNRKKKKIVIGEDGIEREEDEEGQEEDGGEQEENNNGEKKTTTKRRNMAAEIKEKLQAAQLRSRESNQSAVRMKKLAAAQAEEIGQLKSERALLISREAELTASLDDMKSRVRVAASRVLQFARERDGAKANAASTLQSLRQSDALCWQLQETLNARTLELQRARRQLKMIQAAIDDDGASQY